MEDVSRLIERMQDVLVSKEPDREFLDHRMALLQMSCGHQTEETSEHRFSVRYSGYERTYWRRDAATAEALCGRAEARLSLLSIRTSRHLEKIVEHLIDSKTRAPKELHKVADEAVKTGDFDVEVMRAHARILGSGEVITISSTRGLVLMFRCGEEEAIRRISPMRTPKPVSAGTLVKMALQRIIKATEAFDLLIASERTVSCPRWSGGRTSLELVMKAMQDLLVKFFRPGLAEHLKDLRYFVQRPDVTDAVLAEAYKTYAVREVMGS